MGACGCCLYIIPLPFNYLRTKLGQHSVGGTSGSPLIPSDLFVLSSSILELSGDDDVTADRGHVHRQRVRPWYIYTFSIPPPLPPPPMCFGLSFAVTVIFQYVVQYSLPNMVFVRFLHRDGVKGQSGVLESQQHRIHECLFSTQYRYWVFLMKCVRKSSRRSLHH